MRTFIPSQSSKPDDLWRFIGFPASRGAHLTSTLRQGIAIGVVDSIQQWSSLPKAEILRIAGISQRNYARRRSGDGMFTADESECIARFVRVMDAAVQLFEGHRDKAAQWMTNPVRGLGDIAPVTLLDTESGALDVLDLIGRLEHGIPS